MPSLQLLAFFHMTPDMRKILPEIVHENMLHKCAYAIQKRWRYSWLYRKKYIPKIITEHTLTKKCCQRFLYHQFNDKPTVDTLFKFLHAFFLENKEYKIDPTMMEKILNGILSISKTDAHMFFCILNAMIQKPNQIIVEFEQFIGILNNFPPWINYELAKFSLTGVETLITITHEIN